MTKSKLKLERETVRMLSFVQLAGIAGGRTFSARPDITCEPPTIDCPTLVGCGSGGSANTCDACSLTSF